MADPRVSRIVLSPEPVEPLSAGRPAVRRYRLARLEEVASDSLGALPAGGAENGPDQAEAGDDGGPASTSL
jgi:hypothetical protein